MFARSLAVLGVVAIVACSDSTGPSSRLTVGQLEGVWDLSRIEMVLASDSAVYQNVMPTLGLTAKLAIRHDGTASLTVQSTGQSPTTIAATITLHGDTLVYQPSVGSPYATTVTLSGRTMTWLALNVAAWDLNGNGSPVNVYERDVWQRE